MDSTPLGDRVYIVIIAYFLVFLPWTVIQATDFISSEWKTVRDTRRDGYWQFAITLSPIVVIAAYIVLQIRGKDYEEMSAAIVALLFAVQHLVHTTWGLWQVEEFWRWASRAIQTLQSHGICYRFPKLEQERDWQEGDCPTSGHLLNGLTLGQLVDSIKINNSVVDNQIFRGATRCYVVKCSPQNGANIHCKAMFSTPRNNRHWYSGIVITFEAIFIIFYSWSKAISCYCGKTSRMNASRLSEDHPDIWRQMPYDPVEVWINWAVSFAAQGLRDWIDHFDAISDPGEGDGVSSDGYEDRQNFYVNVHGHRHRHNWDGASVPDVSPL